ncbi:5'-3' exoribonuclease 3 [Linum perenne]
MGIPSFYRWLADRYPLSVVDVVEETPTLENDRPVSVDVSLPNPNGYEYDNLYLDMNGIIHPCFHPEGLPPPKDYDEVFQAMFMYIDRIFSIVRPRKLLYLAVDGVAPRAKMNQQRSRRFRAAKDMEDQAATKKAEGLESGVNEHGLTEQGNKLDSNIITPGTEFMELLSSALRYYIHLRMNEEPGWKGIKVILSDASVPGEGEHKIISYIRLQRNLPGFNPNTRHCLYGLDADLIMLALATHEIHFSVLREEVHNKHKVSKDDDSGIVSTNSALFLDQSAHHISHLRFQFLNIWVLREYLAYDLRIPDSESKADLERVIDDFVFMCLFVGNDFLPHIPSLSISEGAIDLLMMLYRKEFVSMGGYLTDSYKINLARVEHFIQAVGSYESVIFRKRMQKEKVWERRNNSGSHRTRAVQHLDELGKDSSMSGAASLAKEPQDSSQVGRGVVALRSADGSMINPTAEADSVKLGEDGWRERYYLHKFQLNSENECERVQRELVIKYVEGLSWVMHYYYEGVCSWQWFYPYHYAPFASDFHDFGNLKIKFKLGKPFKPFDQLMGVLPVASAHALPLAYGKLMKDDSPIADLYPTNFEIDMDGKRFSWQGLCKLPFIDEARLLSEIAKVENLLTDEEKRRNSLGSDFLFFHKSNPMVALIPFSETDSQNELLNVNEELKIDPKLSDGMNGYICVNQHPLSPVEICSPLDCWPEILNTEVITVSYKFPPSHPHIAKLPEGLSFPKKSVSKLDINAPVLSLYDGASNRLYSRKLMPMSVYGPHLARLAHQLVYRYIETCKKDDKKISESSTGHQDNKTAVVPVSFVRKMDEIIAAVGASRGNTGESREDNDSYSNNQVTGDKRKRKMCTEGGRKRKKRKSKKKQEGGGDATECLKSGEPSSVPKNQFKGNERERKTFTEAEPKKKKRKSKKKQEGSDATEDYPKSGEPSSLPRNKFTGDEREGETKTFLEAEPKKKKRKAKKKQECGDATEDCPKSGERSSFLNNRYTGDKRKRETKMFTQTESKKKKQEDGNAKECLKSGESSSWYTQGFLC